MIDEVIAEIGLSVNNTYDVVCDCFDRVRVNFEDLCILCF